MIYSRLAFAVVKNNKELFQDKYVLELARIKNTLLDILTLQNIELFLQFIIIQ